MITNPCYKCEKRVVGCHCFCEEYKSFKEEITETKKKMRSEYDIDDYMITRQTKVNSKNLERKKNRRFRRHKK